MSADPSIIDTYVIDASGKATILKDPDAILDYTWDWTDYLTDIADTIATKTIVVPTGITVVSSSVDVTNKKVTAWLSGGVAGNIYMVTCRIVTANTPPRTDDRSIYLKVRQR